MRWFTFAMLLLLALAGCDTGKFTGYNYGAGQFQQTADISGKVLNKFTGQGVAQATIQINNQRTVTDAAGNYRMLYVLTADDNLNRPAKIEISAENYLPTTTTSLIFPDSTMQLDFELAYGAPIIEAAVLPDLALCQAIVMDYQGIEDIESVSVHLSYVDNGGTVRQEIDLPMAFHGSASNLRAYYQTEVETTMDNLTVFRLFSVTATDRNGFTDSLSHVNDPRNPDQPLFPR